MQSTAIHTGSDGGQVLPIPPFSQLVDMHRLQAHLNLLHAATGLSTALLDESGQILATVGLQPVCTGFHRCSEGAAPYCAESDLFLAGYLYAGRPAGYRCRNGMWDYACPIMVAGSHLATLYIGQFHTEQPDRTQADLRAAEYGFDAEAYWQALCEAPVVEPERVQRVLDLARDTAELLAEIGLERHVQMEAQQRRLEESETLYRAVFEQSPDSIVVLDKRTGRPVRYNDAACHQFGCTPEQMSALRIPPVAVEIATQGADAGATGHVEMETRHHTVSGEARDVHLVLNDVRVDDTECLLCIFRDVTERKQNERRLVALASELARSNNELQQFAYTASHDLQEPLRMVCSFLKLIEERYSGQLDADADTFIRFAVEGATRMQHMVRDLLEYARVQTQGAPLMPVSSREMLERALFALQDAIHGADAEISCGEMPVVHADAAQLSRLFQNLLSNAIKFRHPDRPLRICVDAERTSGGWVFRVSDNGIGIPPEQRERVFALFQRLHAHSTYPGTGIGLAVCKRIVERHGGWIVAEASAEGGACFRFCLPDGQ